MVRGTVSPALTVTAHGSRRSPFAIEEFTAFIPPTARAVSSAVLAGSRFPAVTARIARREHSERLATLGQPTARATAHRTVGTE
ncbi:hypothetical protein [Natrinema soli]|uniref:Uncharacterized protein n=1 Tax=Natrinema soli TaxID=1930624 RepID=A0ABD5SXY9_9EURY|nr:hypothetical protein [Natrinema soli]